MTEPLNLNVPGDVDSFGLPKEGNIYLRFDLIPNFVANYVRLVEAEETNRICRCEWIVHPDDENKTEGRRRIRKGEPALDCPVHTKEGFLIGFFRWILTDQMHFQDAVDSLNIAEVKEV